MGKLSDAGLAALAQKLSCNLTQLSLSFGDCTELSDAGLAALGQNLGSNLTEVELDFVGFKRNNLSKAAYDACIASSYATLTRREFAGSKLQSWLRYRCGDLPTEIEA